MDTDDTATGAFMARRGRRLARAMTSPSTILVTGGVAAATIAAGAAFPLVGLAAVLAYGAKVAVGTFTGRDRGAARGADVDLRGLSPRYATYVLGGLDARKRFVHGLATAPPGPLRDRLAATTGQIDEVIAGLARAARRAQGIDEYLSQPDVPALPARLMDAEARLAAATDPEVRPELERTVRSLRDQNDVAARMRDTHTRSVARLESTVSSLQQLSAQLAETLLTAESSTAARSVDVDDLIANVDSVRRAVAELDPAGHTLTPAELEVQQVLEASPAVPSVPAPTAAATEVSAADEVSGRARRRNARAEGGRT